jgi:hypothetical protein
MTNFAFIPGIGDKALEGLSTLTHLSSNAVTVVVEQKATLSNFLLALQNGVEILGWDPAGDLLIGAHGDSFGDLQMALDEANTAPAHYESLEDALHSKSIRIPDDVRSPGTAVRLLSCSIGADECRPFLLLLKSAMGNPTRLTAPRFIHSYEIQGDQKSVVELMFYDFFVAGANNGRARLATRDAVLGKFVDADLRYFDGTAIDPDLWDTWIPLPARLSLNSGGQTLNTPYPVTLTQGNLTVINNTVLTFAYGVVPFDIEPLPYHGFVPTDDTAKFGVLDAELPQIAKYQDTHKYPVFKRWGFKRLSDFIRGWNWKVNLLNGKLKFFGTRYMYELKIPITKPGASDLIYNYFAEGQAPTINFTDANLQYRLFAIV